MPHNVTTLSQITPLDLTSLEECTEESVYAPGHIQPHGIVFLLQGTNLNILQTSENVEEFFGISAEELLGQPLQRLLGDDRGQKIVSNIHQQTLNFHNFFEIKLPLKDGKVKHLEAHCIRYQMGGFWS
jgi:chemotaxis family two-component system sensor kinase Cph1